MLRTLTLVLVSAAAFSAAAQPAPPPVAPAAPSLPTREAVLACLGRFKDVGVPAHRSETAHADQAPVVCRRGYALSFNLRTRNPDWVVERLTRKELVGSATRRDNFAPDPLVQPRGQFPGSPTKEDYTNFGRDRGHQAPAADAKFDQRVMDESFYMSNMSPQVGIGFNRGQWKYLEEAVRAWVLCGGREDILVMTGPIYGENRPRIGPNRDIIEPEAYYKIVYDLRSLRAVGFKLFNTKHKKQNLSDFVVPISQLEDETGLDFFPNLPRRRQAQLETSKGAVWGHDQSCSVSTED